MPSHYLKQCWNIVNWTLRNKLQWSFKRISYIENAFERFVCHYDDVIMTMLASQITSLTVVYSIVYSGVNQRKHQSSASLAFVREIHRGPVNFPHKWPVTQKMFPFDDVIMCEMAAILSRPQCVNKAIKCVDFFHMKLSIMLKTLTPDFNIMAVTCNYGWLEKAS